MVFASVSSSAPVGIGYNGWKYWSNVGWGLANETMGGSQTCYDAVAESVGKVDTLITSFNYAKLRSDFKLCEPSIDLRNFREQFAVGMGITGPFGTAAYWNEMAPGVSIRITCATMTNQSKSNYDNLRSYMAQVQKSRKLSCMEVSYSNFISTKLLYRNGITNWTAYEETPGDRAWWYQVCRDIGLILPCDRTKQCPLSGFINLEGFLAMCQEVFGTSADQVQQASKNFKLYFGGSQVQVGRLVATNGVADPAEPYGIHKDDPEKQIYPILIDYVGHIADAYPPKDTDVESLVQAREKVLQQIGQFLEEAKDPGSNQGPRFSNQYLITISLLHVLLGFILKS